mgnify:CR=1 FL=1
MDTLEVLVKARGLLAKPESWIQGGLSETAAGDPVPIEDERAVCFCLDGALMVASGTVMVPDAYLALGFPNVADVWDWNDDDERTHAEVLARLDEAIAKLRTDKEEVMETLEIIRKTRALIATPETWTTQAGARDHDGAPVSWDAPEVACRCLYIAVATAARSCIGEERVAEALGFLRSADIAPWNDAPGRTHAEVLARIDEATARLQARKGAH